MFDNKVPKYSKIEVKLYDDGEVLVGVPKRSVPRQTRVLEYYDAGLVITGNHLIVVLDEKNIDDTGSSTGIIFNLNNVVSYKTHNQ